VQKKNALTVLKFGGTSVGTPERIKRIALEIVRRAALGEDLVVVVSAMGKSTDHLVSLAKDISENPCKKDMDLLLATGEQVSIALLSMAIKDLGFTAKALTGAQAGIMTDNLHSKARIEQIDTARILKHLAKKHIVVVAGFQGVTEDGDITTLGRGGSDTTAVSLAAILKCPVEIFTDVDGVYTTDPRMYPKAKKLKVISYDEMLELASLGASIMETRAIEIGHKYSVPMTIALNTFDIEGTIVKEFDESMEKKVVTGMTLTDNCLMVSVAMIPYESKNVSQLFSRIASEHILVDMISQTAPYNNTVNLSFTTLKEDRLALDAILADYKTAHDSIDYYFDNELVKLSVVGIGMVSQSGVASRLFSLLSDHDIKFYQVTTSEISISYTIHKDDKMKAIQTIADAFEL
jgi:aspartate kinase